MNYHKKIINGAYSLNHSAAREKILREIFSRLGLQFKRSAAPDV